MLATCEGPTDGFRGPLARYYTAHRAARLAVRMPKLLRVLLRRPCVGPSVHGLPLEKAWERKAASELQHALDSTPGDDEAIACEYPWLLLVDGAGPPKQLATRMRQGFTIFKQESPFSEHFHALLAPWVHFIPVADNLVDLPQRVSWAKAHPQEAQAIARNAQQLSAGLHLAEVACFWWQLLTSFAPLQDFEPRDGESFSVYTS